MARSSRVRRGVLKSQLVKALIPCGEVGLLDKVRLSFIAVSTPSI